MASRRRLGVALVLDPPLSDELQGLRRALGDPSMERVPPHLTLVPPVNVRVADLGAALEVLRAAAARQKSPLRLTLGPPATFLPDNPVLFLGVGGDIERLRELRDAVFRPPLERPLSWPWVPHFTLADGIGEDRIASALVSLDRYTAVADFDRVVMLEESKGRVWHPLGDACLGPPATVGTGGLAVRITRGTVVDPAALQAMDDDEQASQRVARLLETGDSPIGGSRLCAVSATAPIVLTAHRAGELIGTAAIWNGPRGPRAAVFVSPAARREGTGGHLLAQLESAALEAGWEAESVTGEGPAGFYESRSAWVTPAPVSAGSSTERTVSPGQTPTRTRRRRTAPTS